MYSGPNGGSSTTRPSSFATIFNHESLRLESFHLLFLVHCHLEWAESVGLLLAAAPCLHRHYFHLFQPALIQTDWALFVLIHFFVEFFESLLQSFASLAIAIAHEKIIENFPFGLGISR